MNIRNCQTVLEFVRAGGRSSLFPFKALTRFGITAASEDRLPALPGARVLTNIRKPLTRTDDIAGRAESRLNETS
jgi:hypothetical protein